MASVRKEITLNRQLFIGAWQTAMGGDHPAAFRLKKLLSNHPEATYKRKAGTLKLTEKIEEFIVHPYSVDVAWLWAQVSKPLDGIRDPKTREKTGPSPAVVDLVLSWAEALGYDQDQSVKDRLQNFLNLEDSEPKDEAAKAEEKNADAGDPSKS